MKRAHVTEELAYGSALERLTGADKSAPTPLKKELNKPPEITRIKLSVFLNGEEDAYLETLASTAKFSGGKKISKTRLIEAMVKAFSAANLDVRGVKTDEELLKRVTAQLR
tara:strand:- start:356 stop:688 length:333 start_codon:yes stop_codon:yes gene_type:complete